MLRFKKNPNGPREAVAHLPKAVLRAVDFGENTAGDFRYVASMEYFNGRRMQRRFSHREDLNQFVQDMR